METVISVITPCYNGEPFIRDAIRSVLGQNNPAVEMIVVDDGSRDGTAAACREFESGQIRCFHIENHGAGYARNYGLQQARGRWIAFLDSDDLLLTGCFRREMTDWLMGQEDADILRFPKLKTDFCLENPPEVSYPEGDDEIPNHIPRLEFCTCLFRTAFLREKDIRFFTYRKQDVESAYRYRAFSEARVIRTYRESFFFLQRDNLSSNTHTWNRYNLYEIKADIYRELAENTPCPQDRPFLLRTASDCVFFYYKLCLKHGYPDREGLDRVHEIFAALRDCAKVNGIGMKGDKRYLAARVLDSVRFALRQCRVEEEKKQPQPLPRAQGLQPALEKISRQYPMHPWIRETGSRKI